jgi:DNA replication and repair protein RecF
MISELKLHNFRCFKSSVISLSPGINFFYGNNGSGKTSILEAIYMCSSGRSFKSSNIQSLILSDKNFFSINGYDSSRGFTLSITKEISKPISIKINNTKTTTSNLIKEFPFNSNTQQYFFFCRCFARL